MALHKRPPVKPRVIPSLQRRRGTSHRVIDYAWDSVCTQLRVGELPRRASPASGWQRAELNEKVPPEVRAIFLSTASVSRSTDTALNFH